MKQLLISLFFTILVIHSYGQSCTDTAIKINYYSAGYQFKLQQHIVSTNDAVSLCGNYFNIADSGVFYIKIQPDGTVATSKQIHSNNIPYNNTVNGFLNLQNGNILLAIGNAAALNGGTGDTTFKLILLNPSGNIIWAKKYTDANYSKMAIKTIKEASNNDFIIMMNFIDANPVHEDDFGTAFIKIDALGNLIWSNYYSIIPNNTLEGATFSILNNKIYCVGTKRYGNDFFLGFPNYEDNLWVAKIDANTGLLIDSKSYLDLRIQASQSSLTFFSYIYGNLNYTGDGQFIYTDRHRASNHIVRGLKKSLVDTNLVFSNALFFNYTNQAGSSERILANAKKEVILYSDSIIASGNVLTKTYISKFDAANNPIREMQIKYPAGLQFQGVGWKPIGLKDKYISLINSYQVSGDTYLQLFQMPDDIALSDCYGSDTSFVQIQPYSIVEVNHPFVTETRTITLQQVAIIATSSLLPISTSNECIVQSACSGLSVTGQDTICNTNTTYTFIAHKNSNCLKHVLWQIDSSAVQSTQQMNDTTFNIIFKKSWQGYLYVSINSCSILKDSIKITVFKTPSTVSLGNDTLICRGSSLILHAGVGFKNYYWQNGSTDSTFTVTQSGIYYVTTNDHCGNNYKDTIDITVNEPAAINLGIDTSICINKPLILDAGAGFTNYLWNTGNTTQFQSVVNAGTYSIVASNIYGCLSKDTIRILNAYPAPLLSLSKNSILCLNQNNKLTAGSGFTSYLWQDGSTDSIIVVTNVGLYKVRVSNTFNCFSADSVNIIKIATAPTNFLNQDSTICTYETLVIIPKNKYNSYLWSTGSNNSTLTIIPPANIWLQVVDNYNCKGVDTIKIFAKDCPDYIYIPNAFTPNNDSKNDVFKPIVSGRIEHYQFSVFNRYGQMIFNSSNYNEGWDGKILGMPQDGGVFVWICTYKFRNQEVKFKKGTVTLIR